MAYELLGAGGLTVQDQLTTYSKRLLSRFRAEAIFNQFGLQATIPRFGGRGVSFRGLTNIYPAGLAGSTAAGSAPSALTEGTPGASMDATWRQIIATVSQYGQYLIISDLAEEQSIDNVAPQYVEGLAESMVDALDLITRDVLVAGTNVSYASIAATRGGASGVGSGMYLSLVELRKAKRILKRNNAPGVRSQGGKYVVITHSDALYDLEGDSNITNIWQYAGERGEANNQLFDVSFKDLPMGFRLFETTNVRIFASLGLSGADVYATLVIGEEAYGTVKLDSLPARVITHDRGSSGIVDPLDQAASIGWKAAHTAVILNQANMVRIEHATSTKNAA